MPSADQVPIKLPHLTMLRPKWGVLTAGSTGSALRAVRPPNLHITPAVTLALGHHRPGHPRNLVGKGDGGNLGRAPPQQRREPGPMPGAMDLGIADHGECSGHEQAAQIAVSPWSLILPSRSLPPLECCFGTSPIQAEK